MKKHLQKKILSAVIFLSAIYVSSQILAQANIPPSGVQINSLSVEQLQQAAEAGDPDAQYALGYLYYYGKNVSQNAATAFNWIKRASVQGQEQAIQAMHTLAPDGTQTKLSTQSSAADEDEQAELTARSVTTMPSIKNENMSLASGSTKAAVATANDVPEIKNVPRNYYTIQLLVTANKTELNRYVQMYALSSKATYYATKKNGRVSYVLLYGSYKTRSEAQSSLLKLPTAVKAQKPWIKQVSQMKVN